MEQLSTERDWLCLYARDPSHQSAELALSQQMQDLSLVRKKLSEVEVKIQELMLAREDLMCEVEDKKAVVEQLQESVLTCRKNIRNRWNCVSKRYDFGGDMFSLFCLLPTELYVHIFKYLSSSDLCHRMMRVSKYFNQVSRADPIWRCMYIQVFGEPDDICCQICSEVDPIAAKMSRLSKNIGRDSNTSKDISQHLQHYNPTHPKQLQSHMDIDMMDLTNDSYSSGDSVLWLKVFKHRFQLEYNWVNGRCTVTTLTGHTDWITCLQIHNNLLFSASWDSTIKVWDMSTNECLATLTGHTAGVNTIELSTDRNMLLSSSLDQSLRVWDLMTYQCKMVLQGHTDQISFAGFLANATSSSPDATVLKSIVVSGGLDCTVRVWNVSLGKCVSVFQGHAQGITALATEKQWAASGSADGSVMVWDVVQGKLVLPLLGHTDRVTTLLFDLAHKRLVSTSWDYSTRIWDLASGSCLHVLKGHVFRVRCASLQDNLLVTGSWDNEVKVWDASTGRHINTLSGHSNHVWSVKIQKGSRSNQREQRVISSSWDKTVRVWDAFSGKCLSALPHEGEVLCMEATSHRLVGGSKEIRIWNFSS